MRILIVEDDERVADALSTFLIRLGYDTSWVTNGTAAIARIQRQTPRRLQPDAQHGQPDTHPVPEAIEHQRIGAVLLDLGLPDVDGLEVCRTIRRDSDIPIIVATARSNVEERIKGLQAGADDFVVKPYDVRELVARVEAVTRRTNLAQKTDTQGSDSGDPASEHRGLTVGGVHIDTARREVTSDGAPVELTPKEFDILAVLARYPGVVVPRDRLIREVWGTEWRGFSRSLEVHVGSIRSKLERPDLITTVRGIGYRLADAPHPQSLHPQSPHPQSQHSRLQHPPHPRG